MPQQDDIFFEEEQPSSNESMGGDSSFPGEEPEKPKKGGANRRTLMLLVLLLVIVAAGAYFFIMAPPQPAVVQTPPAAKKKVVKLPARKAPAPVAQKEAPKAAPVAEAPTKPEAKPEPVAKAEAEVEAKPIPVAKAEAKPAAMQQEVTKEVLPEAPVVVETLAGVPVAPVMEVATEEAAPVAGMPYSLQVGAYILESNVKQVSRAVEQLGYAPRLLPGKKTVEMTRLLVGSFDSREQGQARLDGLRPLAPDAFAIWEEQQMVVYAGSYFSLDRARSFADHLYSEGVRVEEIPAAVQIDITTMQFGAFADRPSAEQTAAVALEDGLEVLVVKNR